MLILKYFWEILSYLIIFFSYLWVVLKFLHSKIIKKLVNAYVRSTHHVRELCWAWQAGPTWLDSLTKYGSSFYVSFPSWGLCTQTWSCKWTCFEHGKIFNQIVPCMLSYRQINTLNTGFGDQWFIMMVDWWLLESTRIMRGGCRMFGGKLIIIFLGVATYLRESYVLWQRKAKVRSGY